MKNNLKKTAKILFHVIFWTIAIYIFLKYSYSRPLCNEALYKEFLSVAFMAAMVYLNYFIFIPYILHKKHYLYYGMLSIVVILLFGFCEYFFVRPEIVKSLAYFPPEGLNSYLNGVIKFTIFRYASIFSVFSLLKLYELSLLSIEKEKQLSIIKEEKANLEKKYLRSRISPHYLLNVVSSMQAGAINHDEQLPEHIGKLAMLLNYYINYSGKEKVFLTDEIRFYQNYLELELQKRSGFLTLSFIVEDLPQNVEVAPLLFEPIISNACKWVNDKEGGLIKFQFLYSDQNKLVFESKSNVTPIENPDLYINNETFDNLFRRLQVLYPNRFLLTKKITGNYLEVKLSLLLN